MTTRTLTLPVPHEHAEQAEVIRWAETMKPAYPELGLIMALPNFAGHMGGKIARLRAGARAKREGRKKGVPDLLLPVARGGYHGLFVELKRVKGGSVKPEQRAWIEALQEQGYAAVVCRGAESAIACIRTYLNNGKVAA